MDLGPVSFKLNSARWTCRACFSMSSHPHTQLFAFFTSKHPASYCSLHTFMYVSYITRGFTTSSARFRHKFASRWVSMRLKVPAAYLSGGIRYVFVCQVFLHPVVCGVSNLVTEGSSERPRHTLLACCPVSHGVGDSATQAVIHGQSSSRIIRQDPVICFLSRAQHRLKKGYVLLTTCLRPSQYDFPGFRG